MVYPLIRLKVESYARWKPVFDSLAPARRGSGSRGGKLFAAADDHNQVFILWEWDSLAAARRFFQSPELREAMQRAGVSGQPEMSYLEEVEYVAV